MGCRFISLVLVGFRSLGFVGKASLVGERERERESTLDSLVYIIKYCMIQ